jgi:very-short-patch-repair endonuclease
MSIRIARELRCNPTDAEQRLWSRIRRKQLNGHRFRRQVPLGPYVVDFACLESKLVVEVDGGQHALDVARDAERTAWLQAQGFRVLRFWNNEVLGNTGGVIETIRGTLGAAPHPRPPPQGGREK